MHTCVGRWQFLNTSKFVRNSSLPCIDCLILSNCGLIETLYGKINNHKQSSVLTIVDRLVLKPYRTNVLIVDHYPTAPTLRNGQPTIYIELRQCEQKYFETRSVFSRRLKRSVKMVKIIEISMFLIIFLSLLHAEAATFTTARGMFTCKENICEFNGINDMDTTWTSPLFSTKLEDVVKNMVKASENLDWHSYPGFSTEPVAWKNLTDVSFKNSHFEEIPSVLFESLSGLMKFEAVNVQLKDVKRDDFKFATSLRHLDLSRNRISYVPNKLLSQLSKLISVNLSNNAISIIHDSAFDDTSFSLILLDLGFNKLKEFKDDLMVQLSDNRVNLEVNLENNQLHEFGRIKRKETNPLLATLYKQIHVIQHVNIKNNQISTIRFLLTQTLEADNNRLKEFSIDEYMVNVSLNNNEISSLNFPVNASVVRLALSGNKLNRAIVEKIKDLDLTHLDLSDNFLAPLEIGTFAKMTSLEELNLAAIGMESISFGLFSHQQKLKHLNISRNKLTSIDQHMLISLENLITLDVSGNKLTKLTDFERYHETFPKLITIAVDGSLSP